MEKIGIESHKVRKRNVSKRQKRKISGRKIRLELALENPLSIHTALLNKQRQSGKKLSLKCQEYFEWNEKVDNHGSNISLKSKKHRKFKCLGF